MVWCVFLWHVTEPTNMKQYMEGSEHHGFTSYLWQIGLFPLLKELRQNMIGDHQGEDSLLILRHCLLISGQNRKSLIMNSIFSEDLKCLAFQCLLCICHHPAPSCYHLPAQWPTFTVTRRSHAVHFHRQTLHGQQGKHCIANKLK